jgi:hypothetical protein
LLFGRIKVTAAYVSLLIFRSSEPVTLRDDHYIRRWISYLGTVVVEHAAATIIITVAVGVSLCVSLPFLNHPASSTHYPKLPGRVWTSAESFANDDSLVPDISIKQAWIHGSWGKALEPETLLEAVAVQGVLLGPKSTCDTVHAEIGAPGSDLALSFTHSPLLYWNCSVATIESDESILRTLNSRPYQVSPANITLKPSSVLAGIILSYNRLVAADALVLSLFYKGESRAGALWDERAETLVQRGKRTWNIYPADGRVTRSRLFNFQSRPIDVRDEALFFGAYSLVALYIIFSIRNLRTLKSRLGLFMAIALQVSAFRSI